MTIDRERDGQGDNTTMGAAASGPVIRGARFFLAHTPGLLCHGSKPRRELARDPALKRRIAAALRSFREAAAYPPTLALLGRLTPDDLWSIERPRYRPVNGAVVQRHPHGYIVPNDEFYALLRLADRFDLVWLEDAFLARMQDTLRANPLVRSEDFEHGGVGRGRREIEERVASSSGALRLALGDDALVGCVNSAHTEDASLEASVLLENLAAKTTAAFALRLLLQDLGEDPTRIDYVLGSGEEAVGDRYQRGGGNLGKAVAELCGCGSASGSDVKAFCCGPLHALVIAAAMIAAGVCDNVAVVGGCSLAKLGMKMQGHLDKEMPLLEDTLVGFAILLGHDDERSPVIRLEAVGRQAVDAGSSQQAILEQLVARPLERQGLTCLDVDKYATELHDADITEPAGSGDIPARNYTMIAGLAALRGEIDREAIPAFVRGARDARVLADAGARRLGDPLFGSRHRGANNRADGARHVAGQGQPLPG